MVDDTTISDYALSAPPLFRLTQDSSGNTIIRTYDTNYPLYRINGDIGGGVKVMSRTQRLAYTPAEGELIYDTNEDELYVGDGVTRGGLIVSGGKIDVMTTERRMAYTPKSGDLVFDSDEGKLYIGDGHTAGGIPVGADVPALLAMGEWTDEMEDVYTPGDGNWTR